MQEAGLVSSEKRILVVKEPSRLTDVGGTSGNTLTGFNRKICSCGVSFRTRNTNDLHIAPGPVSCQCRSRSCGNRPVTALSLQRPTPDGTFLRPAATMVLAEATQAPDLRRGVGVVLRREGSATTRPTTRPTARPTTLTLTMITDTKSPFCRTYLFPDDVTGYACQPQQSPTTQSAAFTWFDQPNRPLFTSTPISPSPQNISSTPESASESSPAGPATGSGNSYNPNIPVIVGGSVGGLAVLILAAVAVFFIKKKSRAGKADSAGSADSGAATAPTYSRLGLDVHTGGAHNRGDGSEPSPLSRNPPMVSYYPRDSVSAISQQGDPRMSIQSSGTLDGYQQSMGPGGQPETT
ncbi:hypothetical protein RB595_001995 [Gaeumannomyces hyphopodioides]